MIAAAFSFAAAAAEAARRRCAPVLDLRFCFFFGCLTSGRWMEIGRGRFFAAIAAVAVAVDFALAAD